MYCAKPHRTLLLINSLTFGILHCPPAGGFDLFQKAAFGDTANFHHSEVGMSSMKYGVQVWEVWCDGWVHTRNSAMVLDV